MRKLTSLSVIVLLILAVTTFTGCPEIQEYINVEITDVTTTMDTVSFTLSEDIVDIDMPNTVTFAFGSYSFDVYKDDVKLSNYGLLEYTEDTVTLVMLEQNTAFANGTYTLKISSIGTDPVEIGGSVPFSFQPWSGTVRYIEVYPGNPNTSVWAFVHEQGWSPDVGTPAIDGYNGTYFTLFDVDGNLISFNASNPSDNATVLALIEATAVDVDCIRFYGPAHVPVYSQVL